MKSKLKEQINFYNEFKEIYFKIVKDFNFSIQKDYNARNVLFQLIGKRRPSYNLENLLISFKNLVLSKERILIYGCGPSLETTVQKLIERKGKEFFTKFINIAADGASLFLKDKQINIHAIFTDLDGINKQIFDIPYIFIHAHGDNIDKLNYFENEILTYDKIIGTTQVEPLEPVINPGGFTDGDRILYFLRSLLLPAQKLFLIGMDFKKIIGKYSKLNYTTNIDGDPIKVKKLQYAIFLIEWLMKIVKNNIYLVNTEKTSERFTYLSIEEFEEMVRYRQ